MSRTTPGRAGHCNHRSARRRILQTAQISCPTSNPFRPSNGPPPPGTFATPLTNLTVAPDLPLPYAQNWDLNVQRALGSDMLLEVGYVGTKGTKLPRFIEGNPTVYIPGIDLTPASRSRRPTMRTSGEFILAVRWRMIHAPACFRPPALLQASRILPTTLWKRV